MTQATSQTPPRFPKALLNAQIFLIRRRWIKPLNNLFMVITTTGRKTGRQFSVPIGYVRDGDEVLAFNLGGHSNWYQNMLKNPVVTLEINGEKRQYRGQPVDDDAGVLKVLEVYKHQHPEQMERFFGVKPTDTGAGLLKARQRAVFVRFRKVD
jgi:deazaflavin-dependent oxidoreductase (nitroreductase family)